MRYLLYIWLAGMIPLVGIFVVRIMRGEFNHPAKPTPEPEPAPVKMQVPQVTREDVERVIRRDFAPEQWETVSSLLDEYGDSDSSRVRLAILKLSGGDVEKVLDYVERANEDFRDVVGPAEYPRSTEDWSSRTSPEERAAYERHVAEDWREYPEWLHAE